jgi:hypothetical protein
VFVAVDDRFGLGLLRALAYAVEKSRGGIVYRAGSGRPTMTRVQPTSVRARLHQILQDPGWRGAPPRSSSFGGRLLRCARTALKAGAWCGLRWRRENEIWLHKNAQSGLQMTTHQLIWECLSG